MVLIGLTGGVGMGKSTAARDLQARSIPLLDTDEVAHSLVRPGQPALGEIQRVFGPQVIGSDGELLRKELAGIVFRDLEARRKLEEILHPRIRERWITKTGRWREQGLAIGCVIIPLLYETRCEAEFSRVVCVACSELSQTLRLRERGWSDAEINSRVTAQLPIVQKMHRADYVLWTEGDLSLIHDQWTRILRTVAP